MAKPKRICLGCKKPKAPRSRGLCDSCYATARRAVNAGDTSWAELEKLKLAAPLIRSPFRAALSKSKR